MESKNVKKAAGEAAQSLLRGEISAIETYDQVIAKITDGARNTVLQKMRAEHEKSREILKKYVDHGGLTPTDGSGLWGAWAKLVTGTSKIIGEDAAIKSLKEGEEHGLKSYEAAVSDQTIDHRFKEEIETNLMPKQKAHIKRLDQMLN